MHNEEDETSCPTYTYEDDNVDDEFIAQSYDIVHECDMSEFQEPDTPKIDEVTYNDQHMNMVCTIENPLNNDTNDMTKLVCFDSHVISNPLYEEVDSLLGEEDVLSIYEYNLHEAEEINLCVPNEHDFNVQEVDASCSSWDESPMYHDEVDE